MWEVVVPLIGGPSFILVFSGVKEVDALWFPVLGEHAEIYFWNVSSLAWHFPIRCFSRALLSRFPDIQDTVHLGMCPVKVGVFSPYRPCLWAIISLEFWVVWSGTSDTFIDSLSSCPALYLFHPLANFWSLSSNLWFLRALILLSDAPIFVAFF